MVDVAGAVSAPEARRRGRPPDHDSAATRQRLLDVARQHFARDGYEVTTNRSIAQASGITPAAIYHYFDSKAELYAAVYEEVYDRVFAELERAIIGIDGLLGQYAAALDAAAQLNLQDPTLPAFALGVASDAQRNPELKELLRPLRRRNAQFFKRLVQEAAARGELAADVDLRALEDLLNAVASGLSRISAATGDARRHQAAVTSLQRFLDGSLVAGRR